MRGRPPPSRAPLRGREGELAAILEALQEPGAIALLTGPLGIGKSHLAIEIAHRWKPRDAAGRGKDDAVLYIDLAAAPTPEAAEARLRAELALPPPSPNVSTLSEVLGAWGVEVLILDGLEAELAPQVEAWALGLQSLAPALALLLVGPARLASVEGLHVALGPLGLGPASTPPPPAVQVLSDRLHELDATLELDAESHLMLQRFAARLAGVPGLLVLAAPHLGTAYAEHRWVDGAHAPSLERVLAAADRGFHALLERVRAELAEDERFALDCAACLGAPIDPEALRTSLEGDGVDGRRAREILDGLTQRGLLVLTRAGEHPLIELPSIYREALRPALHARADPRVGEWRARVAKALAARASAAFDALFKGGGASHRWLRANHRGLIAATAWSADVDCVVALCRASSVVVFESGPLAPFADHLRDLRAALGARATKAQEAALRLYEARARLQLGHIEQGRALLDPQALDLHGAPALAAELMIVRASLDQVAETFSDAVPLWSAAATLRAAQDDYGEWRALMVAFHFSVEGGAIEETYAARARLIELTAAADPSAKVRTLSVLAHLALEGRQDEEAEALLEEAAREAGPGPASDDRRSSEVMWTYLGGARALRGRGREAVQGAFSAALGHAAGFGVDYFRLELLGLLVAAQCLEGDREALNTARLLSLALSERGDERFDAVLQLRVALAEALFGEAADGEAILATQWALEGGATTTDISLDRALVAATLRRRAVDPRRSSTRDDHARAVVELARALDVSTSKRSVILQTRMTEKIARSVLDERRIEAADPVMVLAPEALLIGEDGGWCRPPHGARITLRRRPGAVLRELAKVSASGAPAITVEALIARVWPDEKILESAAKNRIRVAIAELRAAGLRDWIVTTDEGYGLVAAVTIRWV